MFVSQELFNGANVIVNPETKQAQGHIQIALKSSELIGGTVPQTESALQLEYVRKEVLKSENSETRFYIFESDLLDVETMQVLSQLLSVRCSNAWDGHKVERTNKKARTIVKHNTMIKFAIQAKGILENAENVKADLIKCSTELSFYDVSLGNEMRAAEIENLAAQNTFNTYLLSWFAEFGLHCETFKEKLENNTLLAGKWAVLKAMKEGRIEETSDRTPMTESPDHSAFWTFYGMVQAVNTNI
ncbi:hypothetical protein [Pseudoalteromonas phage J2-1_QLiu-2017]|nr:hypothetical protein [Pseudoalteromonas phage J2-1_QLiu-2017]